MSTATTAVPTGSTSPVATLEAVYAAFARGDVPALLELLDPDVEIRQSEALPWGGTYRGHAEALRFLGTLVEHIDTRVEIDRFIVAGEDVVEVGRTRGRARATGTEFRIDEAHVWTVRDGRVVRMHAYVEDAAMREALGVR